MIITNESLKSCPFCGGEAVMEKSLRYINNPEES